MWAGCYGQLEDREVRGSGGGYSKVVSLLNYIPGFQALVTFVEMRKINNLPRQRKEAKEHVMRYVYSFVS